MSTSTTSRRGFLGSSLAAAMAAPAGMYGGKNLLQSVVEDIHNPELCRPWSPHPNLQPHCRLQSSPELCFDVESNGSIGCHGGWELVCRNVRPGETYEFCADARLENVPHPMENVSPEIYFFGTKQKPVDWQFVNAYDRDGDVVRFRKLVRVPEDADRAVIRLILRWTAHGTVRFGRLSLRPAAAEPVKPFKVAVAAGLQGMGKSFASNLDVCQTAIREAAGNGAALAVLPEVITSTKLPGSMWDHAYPIPGEESDAFSRCARENNISVALSMFELNAGMVHNTGLVFGPDGHMHLKYRKLQPSVGERQGGMTPGDDLPVTRTPLGRIGMQICYDNTHPETIRTLACRGAELVLMPIMGDPRTAVNPEESFNIDIWRMIVRMRALDNHVWFAVARNQGPGSCIVNPAGEILAEMSESRSLIYADVDLSFRNWSWSGSDFLDRYWHERRPSAYVPLVNTDFRMV